MSVPMNTTALLLAVLITAPVELAAQPATTGHVLDADTRRPLGGVRVDANGREVKTSDDGRFSLALVDGRHVLLITADGFLPATVEVVVDATSDPPLEVLLVSSRQYEETVGVDAAAPVESTGAVTLDPVQVRNVGGGLDNAFYVLQTLPGVAAAGEFDPRMAVRGGGPDQNLTMLDGVEIYNPFRLFGLSTLFNPQTVGTLDFTAGGFGTPFGDRLSSLLRISTRDGARGRWLQGQASLGILDSNGLAEGRLPKGSWFVAGRRSYLNAVLRLPDGQRLPDYGDLQGKATFELGTHRLALFGLGGYDTHLTTLNASQRSRDEGAVTARTSHHVRSARYHGAFGAHLLATTTVSSYENVDRLAANGLFETTTRGSNTPADTALPQENVRFMQDVTVRDRAVRQELVVPLGRSTIEFGGEFHALRTRVDVDDNSDGVPVTGSSTPDARFRLRSFKDSRRGGAWLNGRTAIGPRWTLDSGVRYDASTVNDRALWSPRMSTVVRLTDATRLRASAGRYTQSPGYEKLVQNDFLLDLSRVRAPLTLRHERSDQASLAIDRDLAPRTTLTVEAFVRRFDDVIVAERETETERAARVAQYDFPVELSASVPRAAELTARAINGGSGNARGLDVFLSRAPSGARGVSGWMTYSWSKADRVQDGIRRPFDYDRRHALSLVSAFRVSSRLSFAATARVSSGFPRTAAQGLRVAAVADRRDLDGDGNRRELVPERDSAGRYIYEVDFGGVANVNRARLPWFRRLDLRATWRPAFARDRAEFFVDVINATAEKNAFAITSRLEFDPNGEQPRIREERNVAVGVPLPSIGLRWRF